MDHMKLHDSLPYSEKTTKIVDRFTREADRGFRQQNGDLLPPMNRSPEKIEDYKTLCREILGDGEILTEELLQERIGYILQDSKLKIHFQPGTKCIPIIIPFSNTGNGITPEDFQNGDFLRTVLIDQKGRTVNGFCSSVTYIGDFLPDEIKNIGFTIEPYENNDISSITAADQAKLIKQYTQAFRKLQRLMSDAHQQN